MLCLSLPVFLRKNYHEILIVFQLSTQQYTEKITTMIPSTTEYTCADVSIYV
jgi:hypothetical protein